jgi:hypothetical protein
MTERAQPIEPKHRDMMVNIMGALDHAFNGEAKGKNKTVGIVLLTFSYGDDSGRFNYISNGADRREIAKLFREQAAKFDADPEIDDGKRSPPEQPAAEPRATVTEHIDDDFAATLQRFARTLTDEGKLIEAGWIGMRLAAIARDAPQIQLDEMRMAFFGGAQHLFGCLMSILDPGDEPTEADYRRMELIDAELKEFIAAYSAKYLHTEGSA